MTSSTNPGDIEVPREMAQFAQCPRLLPGENEQRYHTIYDSLMEDTCPTTKIEWLFLADLAMLFWDIDRYQNWKQVILSLHRRYALEKALRETNKQYAAVGISPYTVQAARKEVEEWFSDPAKREVLEARIKARGYDEVALNAIAFELALEPLAKIERFLSSARSQLSAMLKDVSVRREFKNRARTALDHKLKQDDHLKLVGSSKPQQIAPN